MVDWIRVVVLARGYLSLAAGHRDLTRGGGGPGAARPVPESRGLGFSDSGVGFSARGVAARPDSREKPPRDPGSGEATPRSRREISPRDSAARFPEPENPRLRHPAAPSGRADATVLFCCVCQEGSAPRSVSSPGLLGKPCLKTRKETRSNGAHPCFVPFKLECSKDSGERRLAVCCFFRRVGPGLRPSRRDIGKHTRFRLSPQADSEVEPLLNLPPPPAFLRAEFATAMLRPALERLNLTQRAQSLAPLYAQAVVEPASRAGTKRQSRLKTLRGLRELRVRVFTGARAERGSAFSALSA